MMITIKTSFFEKVDEKIILISIIGILEAIKCNAVTIDEAEKYIFSPRIIKSLRQKKCDEKIINIIERGCELEDICSLLPEKFDEVINQLKQETIILAENYEEYGEKNWVEL